MAGRHALLLPVGRGEFGQPGGRCREGSGPVVACWRRHVGRSANRRTAAHAPGRSAALVAGRVPHRRRAGGDRAGPRRSSGASAAANAWPCGPHAGSFRRQFENPQGRKLSKYLQAVRNAMEAEVPSRTRGPPRPAPIFVLLGRVLFRTLLAIFRAKGSRRIRGLQPAQKRPGRVLAGWRLRQGQGPVPRVNEFLGKTSFPQGGRAKPRGNPPEMDETLKRLLPGQTGIRCNSAVRPTSSLLLLAGLESLILTLLDIDPVAKASFRPTDVSPVEGVQRAIQIVDDHFGGNPMLGFPHICNIRYVPWSSVIKPVGKAAWPGIAAQDRAATGASLNPAQDGILPPAPNSAPDPFPG